MTAIEPGRLREANMRLVEEFGSQVCWPSLWLHTLLSGPYQTMAGGA